MMWVAARREASALFRSPFAWAVLAAVQFLIAYQFLAQIDLFMTYLPKIRSQPHPFGVTQLVVVPTFGVTALLLLMLIPVLTMHTFSGERRAGTLHLWYSAPIRLSELVGGKFIGVGSVLLVILGLNALMPLTLLWGTPLDLGTYLGGLLGLLGIMLSGTALGLFCSALTAQPAVAAIATLTCLLSLWLIDWTSQLDQAPGMLAQISMLTHFQSLGTGLVEAADLAYFGGLTIGALALTIWRLEGDRRAF